MRKGTKGILYVASAGMELSWLYAWAAFLMTSIIQRPFPLPETIGTVGLAAILTAVPRGRSWRVIYILGLHVVGFMLAALRIIYVFDGRPGPFLCRRWLMEWFSAPRDLLGWFAFGVMLSLALLFWIRGIALGRRPLVYSVICSRFDLGIAALSLLLVIKLLVLVKAGIALQDPTAELLLFAFFVFGFLALGLVRNQGDAQRDYLSGYQGIGVILSFTAVVLLFGAGLVLLCLPYLTAVAEVGYGVVKTAAEPLGAILVAILRFIFFHNRSRQVAAPASTGGNHEVLFSPGESSWWTELLEKIFAWGILGLVGLVFVAVSALVLWYLFRWLFSRTPGGKRPRRQRDLISLWIARLKAVVASCWAKIAQGLQGYQRAIQLYAALVRWGRCSGLPHYPAETPTEYGLRLRLRFPGAKKEIQTIIEGFNQEVYGERALDDQQLSMARLAWRRLRSPLRWPSRLKSWFLQPGPERSGSQC